MEVLKFGAEVVALVILGAAAHRLNRSRARSRLETSTLAAVLVVSAGLAAAGLFVSSRRAVENYRSYARLGNGERLALAAGSITAALSHTPAGHATMPMHGPPTWLRFTEWLRSQIPPDATFYIVSSRDAKQSLFSWWVDWRLLPRIEVDQPDRADWTVFFDQARSVSLEHAIPFAPGYGVTRRRGSA